MNVKINSIVPLALLNHLRSHWAGWRGELSVFHAIHLFSDQWVGVVGDGGNGQYEWFVWCPGRLECSNVGYGSTEIALRDILVKEAAWLVPQGWPANPRPRHLLGPLSAPPWKPMSISKKLAALKSDGRLHWTPSAGVLASRHDLTPRERRSVELAAVATLGTDRTPDVLNVLSYDVQQVINARVEVPA